MILTLNEQIELLKSVKGKEINEAAEKLALKPKKVVRLPKSDLKEILELLIENKGKPNVDQGELFHALHSITTEMIRRYKIRLPKEKEISYKWFVNWLEEQEQN